MFSETNEVWTKEIEMCSISQLIACGKVAKLFYEITLSKIWNELCTPISGKVNKKTLGLFMKIYYINTF